MILKMLHMTFGVLALVNVSMSLYFSSTKPELLKAKSLRIVSHIVYTVLIVLGLWLAFSYGLKLSENTWLMAKLVALTGFVATNYWVVKKAQNQSQMMLGCSLMLALLIYIFAVATTKMPFLF